MTGQPLLEVTDLVKEYGRKDGVRAVNGVSLTVASGETLGLVGESGCGKSTLCRTVLRLERPTSGSIRFQGREIGDLSPRAMRPLRRDLQMVFQDPYASLNPRRRVGPTVAMPLKLQGLADGSDPRGQVEALLERVGLAAEHYDRYPHELSGGQRQRIGIARALALRPKLMLADEPVSKLDLSIQAQIVDLFAELQREMGLGCLFVSHDIGVVRHVSDRIAVMREGTIVEQGPAEQVCEQPSHPYTQELLASVPVPDPRRARARRAE